MIIIHKPELIEDKDTGMLRALFEVDENKEYLWFSVPKEYQKYLTYERGDAFLVGLLLYAMKIGQDIKLNVPVSERLYYTITNYFIKALCIAQPSLSEISIIHDGLESSPIENSKAVGTGFSGGVDSFSTVYDHLIDDCPENYKLTHFTFHNVGSHGDFGGDASRNLFKERLKTVKPFADEMEISTIPIDSNLSEILNMSFEKTHTMRNAATILAMQKLFKVYYYSSAYKFNFYDLSPKASAGAYDTLTLNMLSTESLTFYSAGSPYNRFEKTKRITNYEPSYRYINVCSSGKSTNCSECSKCLRTLLTLDVLNKINYYDKVFDLQKYYEKRSLYIAKVIATRSSNFYSNEIYKEMKRYKFNIPKESIFLSFLYKCKILLQKT